MYHQFNVKKFNVLPTQCICVFCVDLRINKDYFLTQLSVVGFYTLERVCLLRGTNWILMYSLGESESQIHVPWLMVLVAGFSLQNPGFNSLPIHMSFVIEIVALRQVLVRVLGCLLSVRCHQFSIPISVYTLLVGGGKKC
jgi:hypothetical protein